MKLRRSFAFRAVLYAVALIGVLSALPAVGEDAQAGAAPPLSFLTPAPVESPVLLAWAEPALPFAANLGEDRAASKAARKCTKDSDCKLHDYYCDGCNCLSLLVGMNPPKCNGVIVQCLVAPCLNKHAACVDGGCVVAGGAASSK